MDLLGLRGVGPATKEKLALAGIRTVEDLARVRDLSIVAEWSGIAPARLAPLVEEAIRASAPRHPSEALRGVWEATARFGRTLAGALSFRGARAN